uniref:Uncharacterized protein n=1 Tax=Romanomermis culicivorax TaxID=13658 RepID=A0A915JKZ4_ROMCU
MAGLTDDGIVVTIEVEAVIARVTCVGVTRMAVVVDAMEVMSTANGDGAEVVIGSDIIIAGADTLGIVLVSIGAAGAIAATTVICGRLCKLLEFHWISAPQCNRLIHSSKSRQAYLNV